MIRTRDLLLYVLVLVFLLGGIGVTILHDTVPKTNNVVENAAQIFAPSEDVTARTSSASLDREANLQKLREKIEAGEGLIAAGPPVFHMASASAELESEEQEEKPETALPETSRSVRYCAVVDPLTKVVSDWPKTGGILQLAEGARLVEVAKSSMVTVGSSTVSTTTTSVALQLPLSPLRTMSSNCVDSDVIGVALDGTLIKNNETWRFRGYSSETVVGYARDGFAIYGEGIDEELLDSCGGYDNGLGYRYHIRERELFVLGCFAAVPQRFVE